MPPRRAKSKTARRAASSAAGTLADHGFFQGWARADATPPARRKPSGPPSKLATLPQALIHHMLTYVISDVRPTPEKPLSYTHLDLHALGTVSKAWRGHAKELASQLTLGKAIVHIKHGTRQEMLQMRYRLTLRRPFLRELWLVVSPPSIYVTNETTKWLDRLTRFLAASLSSTPRLEQLDLRNCCGASEHIAMLVRAAAKFCPQLQSLILPPDLAGTEARRADGRNVASPDVLPMHDAVLESLQLWHHHGTAGGLHQLRLPSRPLTNRFAHSVNFLKHVAIHCPNIELLDAYAMVSGSNISRDQYIVDRATWDRFCATCTNLREFNWIVAPYATEFFEIFGKYKKPQLTELTLTACRPWDWDKYYDEVGEAEAAAVRTAGVGKGAKRVFRVLRGCPALRTLNVTLHTPAEANPMTMLAGLGLGGGVDSLATATKNSMDTQQFGDDFIDALVKHCPNVERVTIAHDDVMSEFFARRSNPILSFTDLALRRLASLRFLKGLDTVTVNVSGKGMFELVNSPVNEAPGQREFSVALGDDTGASEMAFYRTLEGFLRTLHQHEDPLHFANKKLVLHLSNSKVTNEARRWSETYLTRLKYGMQEIRAKYPTLQFRIEIEGLTKTSFKRIMSFGMFTATAKPMKEHGWTDCPRGALVDGVYLKHELCVPPDYGFGGAIPGFGGAIPGFGGAMPGLDEFDEDYDYDYGGFEGFGGGRGGGQGRRGGGGRGRGGRDGYYGDYENERGFYGMGGYSFFNGLQLDDSSDDDEDDYDY